MPIYQVDAFTSERFRGNPAAVVPLKKWLPDDLMQQIAAENNLSETAFFVPLYPGKDGPGYDIRWFTPLTEIDLCGHATVATAFVIHQLLNTGENKIVFQTRQAGLLTVTVQDNWFLLDFPSRKPQPVTAPALLFKALDVEHISDVLMSRDFFVVLESEAEVRQLQPNMELLKQLDGTGVIVSAKGDMADAVSRCFFPKAGVPEDPVTGSAYCNLIPYWSEKLGKSQLIFRQVSDRGGELVCENKGERVIIGGQATLYMKGEIYLNDQSGNGTI